MTELRCRIDVKLDEWLTKGPFRMFQFVDQACSEDIHGYLISGCLPNLCLLNFSKSLNAAN
ncbi:hypothetical protein W02_17840 [Nitrospira sp. KM1]|uniref:hypothetical protein n=1 Tax=Nitrospira sp. KM1 TaxID=1936990 RepID=UPI0013A7AD9D|nr:hypothetical protein [Nitrospira sp. KM1]BCA54644.1 hypothetical protein W02_17840 [Nitrospira sp. KM1]